MESLTVFNQYNISRVTNVLQIKRFLKKAKKMSGVCAPLLCIIL